MKLRNLRLVVPVWVWLAVAALNLLTFPIDLWREDWIGAALDGAVSLSCLYIWLVERAKAAQ